MRKPDEHIYLLAAERLGLRPDECVMVDDIVENCTGAEMVGMRSVHYVSTQQAVRKLDKLFV